MWEKRNQNFSTLITSHDMLLEGKKKKAKSKYHKIVVQHQDETDLLNIIEFLDYAVFNHYYIVNNMFNINFSIEIHVRCPQNIFQKISKLTRLLSKKRSIYTKLFQ